MLKCAGVAVAHASFLASSLRALGVSCASLPRRVRKRGVEMRKARGAKKALSPRDPQSDKKLREAPNDRLRCADDGGAAPRARKKGYKPPDVRSIFGALGRRGEGHEFREEASEGWCDVCCAIIFQGGLMCTGKEGSLKLLFISINSGALEITSF